MSHRLVHVATADAFIRIFLTPSNISRPVPSRAILDRCAAWCIEQRLFRPSPSEMAHVMRSAGYQRMKSNGQRFWRGLEWRAEPDPFAALAEPDVLRRLSLPTPSMPLNVYCRLTGTARSTFYAQEARGAAPIAHRRGRRVFVTASNAVTWCAAHGYQVAMLNVVEWVEDRRNAMARR